MTSLVSLDRLRFLLNRFSERLWVRPLAVCLLSVLAVFAAKIIDGSESAKLAPVVTQDSVETLLSLMAASMLVIATFSVASMVSAYAAASSTATPRSFTLVLADDVSQNALSTFVGAFIFCVVALTAVKNAFYDQAGLFVLFVLTVFVFALVIVTFVRWVDRIARLGRIGSTIDKVESATKKALMRRLGKPTLGGRLASESPVSGQAVYASEIGYVQHVDMEALQGWAEDTDAKVVVSALPGTFTSPNRALVHITLSSGKLAEADNTRLLKAFQIGNDRAFEDDPRFGLVALSEIAARALSPAVNDPGTAIKVIGTLVRLISLIDEPSNTETQNPTEYERVAVPKMSIADVFDDAFTSIARDGAGAVEVGVRLQKALASLESLSHEEIQKAARYHRNLALKRAFNALDIEEDIAAVRAAGSNAESNLNQK